MAKGPTIAQQVLNGTTTTSTVPTSVQTVARSPVPTATTPRGGTIAQQILNGAGPTAQPSSTPLVTHGTPSGPTHIGGGGFLGSIVGAVENPVGAIKSLVGFEGKAADKVASTTENIGTGFYKLGKDTIDPSGASGANLAKQWLQAVTDPSSTLTSNGNFSVKPLITAAGWEAAANPKSYEQDALGQDLIAMGHQTIEPFHHPLRDPVNTALTAFTLASLGAGSIARAGYFAKALGAARVGETGDLVVAGSKAAKAAEAEGLTVEPLTAGERTALAGKVLTPGYKVPTSLRVIRAPVTRLEKPLGGAEGPAAAVKGTEPVLLQASHQHLMRWYQAAHDAIIQHALTNQGIEPGVLARYGMSRIQKSLSEGVRTTANSRSVLERLLTQSAKSFDKGVSAKEGEMALFARSANVTGKELADYWRARAAEGLPTQKLADIAQSVHDKGLLEQGPDGMRVSDAFPKLQRTEGYLAKAQAVREQALLDHGLMSPEGLASRKALVAETIGSEAARNPLTGVREGLGYTPLKTSEKAPLKSLFTQARSEGVIPAVKNYTVGKEATGLGIKTGLVPDNTTAGVARALHEINRYVNTVEFRGRVARFGSDVRRTKSDILVRDPSLGPAADIAENLEAALGRRVSTLNTIPMPEQVGIRARIEDAAKEAIPSRNPNDLSYALGERAPDGFKWVPRNLVPKELTNVATPRSGLAKDIDTINSAVTAATVYLKLGHFPTRFLTNFATNAVQGSGVDAMLTPFGMGRSARLAKELTDEEKVELASATGTHGYQALPQQGESFFARNVRSGTTFSAQWWATHVDAPFRLNAILYELRQIGVDDAAGVREALGYLRDPEASALDAERGMQIDQAVREANRASIMYDGLGQIEQQYIARVLWFYPWTKGAVRFTFHTVAAHPVKALALGQIGGLGAAYQHSILGNVPSYETGLTPYTGGASPLTGNLASLTPFATLGQVAQMLEHPRNVDTGVASQANPVYSGLVSLLQGHGLTTAASDVVQPTPEMQILTNYLYPPGPAKTFGSLHFTNNPQTNAALTALLRALAGTPVPRPTNPAELNTAAAHQHEKHRDIRIYG